MIDSNIDDAVKQLVNDSKESLNWSLNLDCFILKIIAIPSSKLIWVVGSEEKVFLVDGEMATVLKKFEDIAEIIFSAVIHPKNSDLILCSSSGIRLLTVEGEIIKLVDEEDWFEHIAISSDGRFILASKGKTLYSLEQKNSSYELIEKDASFTSTISDVIFNVDSFLISNYGGVREYAVSNLKDYTLFEWKTSLLNISRSPNKKYIAAGTQENAIHFWPYPLKKDDDFQMGGYHSKVDTILWSEDSKKFFVNGLEDLHIWDFSDGPPFGKSPQIFGCGYGKIIDFIYNGYLLVAASQEGVIFYFSPDHSDQFVNIQAIDAEVTCLSFAGTGRNVYVGSKSGVLYCF